MFLRFPFLLYRCWVARVFVVWLCGKQAGGIGDSLRAAVEQRFSASSVRRSGRQVAGRLNRVEPVNADGLQPAVRRNAFGSSCHDRGCLSPSRKPHCFEVLCNALVTPVPALTHGAMVLLSTERLHQCQTVKAQVPDW